MIEIKTDWTFPNTHIFKDGIEMKYVTDFVIEMPGPRLKLTKLMERDGSIYTENAGANIGEAFIPFETLTVSDFKITQL